jgi:hypothetical protein
VVVVVAEVVVVVMSVVMVVVVEVMVVMVAVGVVNKVVEVGWGVIHAGLPSALPASAGRYRAAFPCPGSSSSPGPWRSHT